MGERRILLDASKGVGWVGVKRRTDRRATGGPNSSQ